MKVRVALDAQSLFEAEKTGIGQTIEKIIDHLADIKKNKYQLNCFSFRNKKEKWNRLQKYRDMGYETKMCGWFPLGIYRRVWNIIPLPYSWFMGRRTEITQFFNYVIPPGVKGKKGVYIYDMVYKAYPETMQTATRDYMEKNLKKSFERADFIITISEFSKREILKYYNFPAKSIYVVPCGVDLSIYKPDIEQEKIEELKKKYNIEGDYFLYLGTLEPRKNIPVIIEAYKFLEEIWGKQENEKLPQLILAGKSGWEYKEIFELINRYDMQENVIFTGYVGEEEKPILINGAISFLFPSLYEGFGMPPLEAMACGTPVIVSNRASLPEIVGKAGSMVEPDDYKSIAYYMKRIYEDKDYRETKKKQGIERSKLFSWENAAQKLESIYESLI